MFDKHPSGRAHGVLTNSRTRNTGPARGKDYPPGQLLGLKVGEICMISFSGSDGQLRQTLVFRFGDQLLWDPKNGESYVSQSLEKVPDKLAKQLHGRLAVMEQEGPGVPSEDQVDVMGDGSSMPESETTEPEPVDPRDASTRGRLQTAIASGRPGLVPPPPGKQGASREPLVKTPGVRVRGS